MVPPSSNNGVALDASAATPDPTPGGTIACKSTPRMPSTPPSEPEMFRPDSPQAREPRSALPWIIALGVVLIATGALVVMGHRGEPANPGGAGLAPADPYAASLPIANLQMSQAGNMAGSQTTYVDGQITNQGQKTVTAITVQVAFHGFTNPIAKKETMPLMLVRMREPYVDTQPVGAAPILPGQTREFRLIFDSVPEDWNQNYPEIRLIKVVAR